MIERRRRERGKEEEYDARESSYQHGSGGRWRPVAAATEVAAEVEPSFHWTRPPGRQRTKVIFLFRKNTLFFVWQDGNVFKVPF